MTTVHHRYATVDGDFLLESHLDATTGLIRRFLERTLS
jgi:hypothetical protein